MILTCPPPAIDMQVVATHTVVTDDKQTDINIT